MKNSLSDLAKAAAAAESTGLELSPDTVAKQKLKKKLAVVSLILNAVSLIVFGIAVFADLTILILVAVALALVSYGVSKRCKRI